MWWITRGFSCTSALAFAPSITPDGSSAAFSPRVCASSFEIQALEGICFQQRLVSSELKIWSHVQPSSVKFLNTGGTVYTSLICTHSFTRVNIAEGMAVLEVTEQTLPLNKGTSAGSPAFFLRSSCPAKTFSLFWERLPLIASVFGIQSTHLTDVPFLPFPHSLF